MIDFANPDALLLLFLPILMYVFPVFKKRYGSALRVPFVDDILRIKEISGNTGKLSIRKVEDEKKNSLLLLVWFLSVLALCRPQLIGDPMPVENKGRDILLVVDISNSMGTADFNYLGTNYSRLTAVKDVMSQFIDDRVEDRIGLVLFGTRAYMQAPLTYDKVSLKEILEATSLGIAGNSTSIGDAIGVALKYMAQEDTKNADRVIVLITDGENNDGSLSFPQAIALAKSENVKVYTIGVGSDRTPVLGGLFSIAASNGLDETSLKALASETMGNYFRAQDVNSLLEISAKINELEPQELEGRILQEVYELYYIPAGIALLLFLLLVSGARKGW